MAVRTGWPAGDTAASDGGMGVVDVADPNLAHHAIGAIEGNHPHIGQIQPTRRVELTDEYRRLWPREIEPPSPLPF